jgi:alkylation response protein AidB-like acyl-CoA dehydrogenase
MTFALSEELRLFAEAVDGAILRAAPQEQAQRLDNEKRFDDGLHAALAALGVMGVGVPEAEGGSGGSAVEQTLALERLGDRATSMGVFLVVHYMATHLLADYGSAEQKRRLLPPLCRGETKFAFALTEPGGGTDVLASVKTRGRRDGGGWLLAGSKMWISGAARADWLIVLARTAEHRTRGFTMFLVPRGAPGVAVREIDTMAIHGLDTCEVAFQDVRLPVDAVLGGPDQGFPQVLATLNAERLHAAAVACGIARGAHRFALDYAKERRAFGKPIGQFQALQHRLVRAGIAVEAAWLLTLRAATEQAADIATSMAKLASSEAALEATHVGMEVLGGAGFDMALPMQRWFRDARLYVFAPLTNDMIANYLAERWLGLPRGF